MTRTLIVKHTADRYGRPLAVLENLPGEGAEMNGTQLRQLAAALLDAAGECECGAGLLKAKKHVHHLDEIELTVREVGA